MVFPIKSAAQTLDSPKETNTPLSIIDWLSNTVVAPSEQSAPSQPIAEGVTTETIGVATLESIALDTVGLLPRSVTGLPRAFWGPTSAAELSAALDGMPLTLAAPARALLHQIALAELDPPVDADTRHLLFLARVDLLLRFGALEPAQALLERAGPNEAALFRRWFDVSLLTGLEDRACAALRATPDIAPTFSARVFCLARGNDWAAAALSLETARALGAVSEEEDALLARFLDPELFEGARLPPTPNPLTPLDYRVLLALGEGPSATTLPLAFSHAKLERGQGWKTRLESGERLARRGGIGDSQLIALYTERRPAASGGVWDRVEAVQALDVALLARDKPAVARALPDAIQQMYRAGLVEVLARHYGETLLGFNLREAELLLALSPMAEAAAQADQLKNPLMAAIAMGLAPGEMAIEDTLHQAVRQAFALPAATPLPPQTEAALQDGRLGEVTLHALSALTKPGADPGDVELSLRLLRRLGFESVARQAALSLLVTFDS